MKRLMNYSLFTLLCCLFFFACSKEDDVVNLSATSVGNAKSARLAPPTITCGEKTQKSLDITFTAGSNGAPAGFSLQWMTKAAFDANGGVWYASNDPLLCKGSFSGNANLSRYELKAGESVTVTVGEFLFDNGASTNCGDALECGTDYIFRAFAHATNTFQRSDFTSNLICSTLSCGNSETCTLTQGYWKNHGPEGCASGNNTNMWPVASLTLGGRSYSDVQLCSILKTPAQGNGLVALAHQLIAAKLNVANGADGSVIATAIADADVLIANNQIPPIGTGYLAPSETSALTTQLARYNEGASGPGHCD